MDKKSTIVIAVILGLALVGFIVISFQKSTLDTQSATQDLASTTQWMNSPAAPADSQPMAQKIVITAKHAYRTGEHIIVGEIPLPTQCHILESKGIASADKKQVFFEFISTIKTGEVCAQSITPARFRVNVKADKPARLSATLNGQEVTLNLIEAGPNEDLENFELYLKG